MFNRRVACGFLQTYVVNGGGEKNTPKFNKEYLWNLRTDLDHLNIIRREISSSFANTVQKCFENILYLCVFLKYLKIQLLLRKQTLGFAKQVFHTSHATFLLD